MADLIAQGEDPQHRWRRVLPDDEEVVLGRTAGMWAVAWDPHISRRHAELRLSGRALEVKRLESARNPVYFRGKDSDRFSLRPGEHFVIGRTTFTLSDQRVNVTSDAPQPDQQQSFSAQYLKQVQFRNPDHRIEVLTRLPGVISGAADDAELCVRLVSMLLAGAPRAETAAVVAVEGDVHAAGANRPTVRVVHWDRRLVTGGDFQPSQRLILEAFREQQSVMHAWQGSDSAGAQQFTARGDVDWASCTPVPGQLCRGWGLYLAGRFHAELPTMPGTSDPHDLREDVKFTELVAGALSSVYQMRLLERQQASLSQFFSPVVLATLSVEDPEVVLAPRETEVSVLFCDLRGFSLETERHAGNLIELLNRVSKALGVMTRQILEQGGVVGDFQGDAAMGFWGWPLAQQDAVMRTCRAALGIRAEFEAAARRPESPLAGFRSLLGSRRLALLIAMVFVINLTYGLLGPVLPLYIQQLVSNPKRLASTAGTISGVAAFTGAAAALIIGRLSDRLGHRRVLLSCLGGMSLLYFPQALARSATVLGCLLGMQGFFQGGLSPSTSAMVVGGAPREKVGAALGLSSSASATGYALGPMLGALVMGATTPGTVYLFAGGIFTLVTLSVAASGAPRLRRVVLPQRH